MTKKKIIFLLILVVIISGFLILIVGNRKSPNTKRSKVNKNFEEEKVETKVYSFEQVAQHNKREDCWIIIEGRVYDLTAFIALGQHPPVIEMGCGKDATILFNTRTTETGEKIGSGKPHSEKARELLTKYYLGQLKKIK